MIWDALALDQLPVRRSSLAYAIDNNQSQSNEL
jgi:hypothetical protein